MNEFKIIQDDLKFYLAEISLKILVLQDKYKETKKPLHKQDLDSLVWIQKVIKASKEIK